MVNGHKLAEEIRKHERVDDTRVENNKIQVVLNVDESTFKSEKEIPEEVLRHTKEVLEETKFKPETGDWLDTKVVEDHDLLRSGNTTSGESRYQFMRTYVR